MHREHPDNTGVAWQLLRRLLDDERVEEGVVTPRFPEQDHPVLHQHQHPLPHPRLVATTNPTVPLVATPTAFSDDWCLHNLGSVVVAVAAVKGPFCLLSLFLYISVVEIKVVVVVCSD